MVQLFFQEWETESVVLERVSVDFLKFFLPARFSSAIPQLHCFAENGHKMDFQDWYTDLVVG